MKKIIVLAALILGAGSITINAQSLKIGHINSQELIAAMPESDSAQANIQAEMEQMEEQLETMQVEFNRKYEEYNQKAASYSALVRQTKEQELGELQQRIQQFQMNAEKQLGALQQQLFTPVQEKAKKAIDDVALENGFTYVMDTGSGAIIYFSDDSEDLLPLVKVKLGLE